MYNLVQNEAFILDVELIILLLLAVFYISQNRQVVHFTKHVVKNEATFMFEIKNLRLSICSYLHFP